IRTLVGGANALRIVSDEREQLVSGRPRRLVNGAVAPPRPHFLGHEWQEGREQAKHHRERRQQRGIRRAGTLWTLFAVATPFHQLEVIVAKAPEEGLGPLQDPRVVVP